MLFRLGDLAGALALFEQVLEISSRTLPEDHPDLQAARGNLAATLSMLGDLRGARALEEQVLEIRSRTLPDDHPDLQSARGNLAVTIAAQSACLPGGGEDENQGGRESCGKLILALCQAQTHAVRTVLLASPSREAEERCARLVEQLDIVLSFARGFGVFAALRSRRRAWRAGPRTRRGTWIYAPRS
jgi:hypothetical protein